ncbi:MAG: DUF3090 family protein [Candidatus Rokubacteria bacterium]|nr:DUF3090 family protein [Candidatus Rokubacteria bacterium]
MSRSVDFKAPDFFTTGAVGPPGQRDFYLQVREDGVLLTLKVEKEQVSALAEYVAELLAKHPAAAARTEAVPGDLALVEPVAPAWAVGSLAVGYDEARDRVLIVAEELTEDEEEEEEGPEPAEAAQAAGEAASARLQLSRAQALAFVERARALVRAGRPTCPICSRPMNPGGHVCPRQNGARRD